MPIEFVRQKSGPRKLYMRPEATLRFVFSVLLGALLTFSASAGEKKDKEKDKEKDKKEKKDKDNGKDKKNEVADKSEIVFNRDIRPIFSENCYTCHGPDKNKRKG